MRKKSYILKYNIKTLSQYVYRRSKEEQLCYKVHKLLKFLILIENIRRHFRIKKTKVENGRTLNFNEWKMDNTCAFFSMYELSGKQ